MDAGNVLKYTAEQVALSERINNCKCYYEVLAISADATESDIKGAYKRLALALHPDKNLSPGAAEAFKKLNKAYQVLSDPLVREIYNLNAATQEAISVIEETSTRNVYVPANQRSLQHEVLSPTTSLITCILTLICGFLLLQYLTGEGLYSLSRTSKHTIRRETEDLSVPYFVKDTFAQEFRGSLSYLERYIEDEYIYTMKQFCYEERRKREIQVSLARLRGNLVKLQLLQKAPLQTCENLYKVTNRRADKLSTT